MKAAHSSAGRAPDFALPDARPVAAAKHAPLRRYRVLDTDNLREGQEVTSRVWSRHKSRVLGVGGYKSAISRVPLGRSFLCFVDCRSPMQVETEGNKSKVILYLPLSGSMSIAAAGKKLAAVPGGPVLIPPKTATRFRATAIRCVLIEVSAPKLQAQLVAAGAGAGRLEPVAWDPASPDARALASLVGFAMGECERGEEDASRAIHLLKLESLLLSCIARAIAARVTPPPGKAARPTNEQIRNWIAAHLRMDFSTAELAAFAGVSPRVLQMNFLKHFNMTPTHYVGGLRLDAARAELMDPANTKTVSEIAMALNFFHLGRFASAYRRKFGESPSETLARRKRRPLSRKRR